MEARTGRRKEVAAANHVGPIVDVAAVGGTVTGSHQARVSQLCQVIRDEVLRLPGQFDELTDPAIARSEMSNQLPANRLAEQRQDLWYRACNHVETYRFSFM
jgi:hypothetical protein